MPPSTWLSIYEVLTRHGINHELAKSVAVSDLRRWELDDLTAVLKRIKKPSREYCYFRATSPPPSTATEYFKDWWPSLWSDTKVKWISPPRTMMKASVHEGAALCVNRNGEWSLRTSGYVALSHVWIEGLQRDKGHDGLEQQKLAAIFSLLESRQVKAEWVWADVLAIPAGGQPTANLGDEELTIDIINNLPQIYARADAVIIIDALVLQLHPKSPLDVAVALLCGQWITRVWTFQEIKLANNALVLTAAANYNFSALVSVVKDLEEKDHDRYHTMWQRLAIMEKDEARGLSIPDIVMASRTRESGQDIDYARAFFPVLGLKWEYGMSREQGMQKIYTSNKLHSTRIACYYGAPRMSIEPCWAPTYIHGLEGYVSEPMKWEARGIRGDWFVVKIAKIVKSFRNGGRFVFNLNVDCEGDRFMQCACAPNEKEEVCKAFETAVNGGNCYVLSGQPSNVSQGEFARHAILVKDTQVNAYGGFEVTVFCAAIILGRNKYSESKRSVLICHDKAISEDGGFRNRLRYHFWSRKEENRPSDLPRQEGESELHAAVRNGDLSAVIELTTQQDGIAAFDSRGWTPLHVAAARGQTEILDYLLKQNPDIEVRGTGLENYTPLLSAAKQGKLESIQLLLKHGADIRTRDNDDSTPIMVAAKARRVETVKMLLESGADPNDEAANGVNPLLLATELGQGSLPTLKVLIEGGANVKPTNPQSRTPMHNIVEYGSIEEMTYLLENGFEADGVATSNLWTPLHLAISKNHEDCVQLLLRAGADPNRPIADNFRPIHFAVNSHNRKILELLLERKPDVNACTTSQGRTALHLACAADQVTMAEMLFNAGADPDLKDKDGKDALELPLATYLMSKIKEARLQTASPIGENPNSSASLQN